jgi:hypothetical protein
MTSRTWSRKPLSLALALAIVCTYSMVALAAPQQGQTGPTGDLSVVGEVSVNGTSAISGATVFSDSTITTAQNSSAVVSLGKLGRVEVLPNSSLKLSFNDTGVNAMLDSGRVRLSTSSGIAATVTTKDGAAVADNSQANTFMVDVECGNTVVSTQAGRVELRAGSTVKQRRRRSGHGRHGHPRHALHPLPAARDAWPFERRSGGAPARGRRRCRGGHHRGHAGQRLQLRRQPDRHQPLALNFSQVFAAQGSSRVGLTLLPGSTPQLCGSRACSAA